MVYNFRIAQITKQQIAQTSNKNHMVVLLPFDTFRKKYNGIFQNFLGGLGSYIYNFSDYYFRTDFAFSSIQESVKGHRTFSGVETDDILFTFGRSFVTGDRSTKTVSVLFGVPTHQIYRFRHVDFGYSQVGLGIQFDGSYDLTSKKAFLYGARYIYFVPRHARDPFDHIHTFTLGNIGDILLAYKDNFKPQHGWEGGYTFRARFGAHSSPNFDEIVKKANYLRSNFYAVYKYKFETEDTSNRLLLYIAYGFDHSPKIFGNKYIITLWGSWSVAF